ncbi:MAG: CHRD domain-containing protein [Nitrososphaeraceae archaeon]
MANNITANTADLKPLFLILLMIIALAIRTPIVAEGIHSEVLRGEFVAELNGDSQNLSKDVEPTGKFVLTDADRGYGIYYMLNVTNVENATTAHIHSRTSNEITTVTLFNFS